MLRQVMRKPTPANIIANSEDLALIACHDTLREPAQKPLDISLLKLCDRTEEDYVDDYYLKQDFIDATESDKSTEFSSMMKHIAIGKSGNLLIANLHAVKCIILCNIFTKVIEQEATNEDQLEASTINADQIAKNAAVPQFVVDTSATIPKFKGNLAKILEDYIDAVSKIGKHIDYYRAAVCLMLLRRPFSGEISHMNKTRNFLNVLGSILGNTKLVKLPKFFIKNLKEVEQISNRDAAKWAVQARLIAIAAGYCKIGGFADRIYDFTINDASYLYGYPGVEAIHGLMDATGETDYCNWGLLRKLKHVVKGYSKYIAFYNELDKYQGDHAKQEGFLHARFINDSFNQEYSAKMFGMQEFLAVAMLLRSVLTNNNDIYINWAAKEGNQAFSSQKLMAILITIAQQFMEQKRTNRVGPTLTPVESTKNFCLSDGPSTSK